MLVVFQQRIDRPKSHYLFLPLVWPHGRIGHLGEPAPTKNFQLLLAFLLFYTLHTQFLLLKMGKKINRDREKIQSKADVKADKILKAVEAYQAPDSQFLLRQAAALFECSHSLISNHINEQKSIQYLFDHAVERQKLIPVEEAALKDHIDDCY
jgi:hypothetical protein